jgi:hypothetical protein
MSTFRTVQFSEAALQSKGVEDAVAIIAVALVKAREDELRKLTDTEAAALDEGPVK